METTFSFTEKIPVEVKGEIKMISGAHSLQFKITRYLIVKRGDDVRAFEMRFEFVPGPFEQAEISDGNLVVGCGNYFFMYDLENNFSRLCLKMENYFSRFYFNENLFCVADDCRIYCVDKDGKMKWKSEWLGIDGVLVDDFYENEIHGSGEWDPPGGWKKFVLEKETGKQIK